MDLEYLTDVREFECVVCLEPWTNPCELSCGHIYCRDCVGSLPRPAMCPTCRAPVTSMKIPNRFILNLLGALSVKCQVCEWTGPREGAPGHKCKTPDYASRVTAMYQRYEPSKIGNVQAVLQKYAGAEEEMMTAMVHKYGPVPGLRASPTAAVKPLVSNPHSYFAARVTAMYQLYNPSKIGDVQVALQKYAGREDELMAALVHKYGPEPGTPPKVQEPGLRASPAAFTIAGRVTAIYQHYEPSKLGQVQFTVQKYAGREDELMAALVHKYGPEPTTVHTSPQSVAQQSSAPPSSYPQSIVGYPQQASPYALQPQTHPPPEMPPQLNPWAVGQAAVNHSSDMPWVPPPVGQAPGTPPPTALAPSAQPMWQTHPHLYQ